MAAGAAEVTEQGNADLGVSGLRGFSASPANKPQLVAQLPLFEVAALRPSEWKDRKI
jgi:hypothetical protein